MTAHDISQASHRQHGDQHVVSRHHITASTSHQPHHRFRTLFSRPAGHGRQVQQPQPQTLSQSSSITSIFVRQTFQQPQLPAPAAREYILAIPETRMPVNQVIQPPVATKGQQKQTRWQLTSFIVVDDQQAGCKFKTTHLYIDADETL